jgi:hypothetical protein
MAKRLRRYRITGTTVYCSLRRVHTLSAYNKKEAEKLVLTQYVPKGKLVVQCLPKKS